MAPKTKQPESGGGPRNAVKRDRSWSLLMVGDHGQIIPFRRVKGIAMILITVAILAILAAVGLGLWGGWLRVQNAGLRSELETSRESVRKLRDEKDLLMAKVVILEARNQNDSHAQKTDTAGKRAEAASAAGKPAAANGSDGESASSAVAKSASPAAGTTKTTAPAAAEPEKKVAEATRETSTASAAAHKVAVSAFVADHNPRRNTIEARFRVENTDSQGQKVSGRCVLVMKNAVKSDMQWVSVPHVSLVGGRPNGKQGRAFRIAHFIDLKMQTREVPDNFAFDNGTLYVYDDDGKQILEKEVAIRLSYRKPAPKPEPEPEPEPERQPQRKPESATSGPAQATSAPDAASETAAPKAPSAPSQMPSTAVSPTSRQSGPGETPPSDVTPIDGPAASPAEPSPPAPEQGGESSPRSPSRQAVDPSLLPDNQAAPETAAPRTGVEDTR